MLIIQATKIARNALHYRAIVHKLYEILLNSVCVSYNLYLK